MKKKDLIPLWDAITQLETKKHNIKFSYFVAKLKLKIREEIEVLNKLRSPDKNYMEFDKLRLDLVKECAEKDQNGNPKIVGGNYVVQDQEKFDKDINLLLEKYKDTIKNFEEKIKEFSKIMNEDYNINFDKISIDMMPEMIEPNIVELFIKCDLVS